MNILFPASSFIAANYAYQLIGNQDWAVAHERSFFQVAIVLWIVVFMTVQGYLGDPRRKSNRKR